MIEMDAKEYMEQYDKLLKMTKLCMNELRQENQNEKIAESIADELIKYLDEMQSIHNLLFSIPLGKANEILVLHLRYIQAKSWKETCSRFSESMRQVKRYHAAGLKLVQKILDSNEGVTQVKHKNP